MIHIETSPIEYLFWAAVILGLLTVIACIVMFCWCVVPHSARRKGIPVVVRKKTVPVKSASKKVSAVPASFDTATFIRIYLDNHPALKAELKEELLNG